MVDYLHFCFGLLSLYLVHCHRFEFFYKPLLVLEPDHTILNAYLHMSGEIFNNAKVPNFPPQLPIFLLYNLFFGHIAVEILELSLNRFLHFLESFSFIDEHLSVLFDLVVCLGALIYIVSDLNINGVFIERVVTFFLHAFELFVPSV